MGDPGNEVADVASSLNIVIYFLFNAYICINMHLVMLICSLDAWCEQGVLPGYDSVPRTNRNWEEET